MNTRNIEIGALAGLAGGLFFGVMMGMMGMLEMIGSMFGAPSAVAGFVVHMGISALIGSFFAIALGRFVCAVWSGLAAGIAYGAVWWILGPLTLMPILLGTGLGANWNPAAASSMLPSLMGHLVYGAVLGLSYVRLQGCVAACRASC